MTKEARGYEAIENKGVEKPLQDQYESPKRPEQTLEERGRAIAESARERVSAVFGGLFTSLRSRGASIAYRVLGAAGFGAETGAKVAKGAKEGGKGLAGQALSDLFIEPAKAMLQLPAALKEALNPQDYEKLGRLEIAIKNAEDLVALAHSTHNEALEDAAQTALDSANARKDELLKQPYLQRPNAKKTGAALKAAGAVAALPVVGAVAAGAALAQAGARGVERANVAGGAALEKAIDTADRKKEAYLKVGEILSARASALTGKTINLTPAQAIALGAMFEGTTRGAEVFRKVGDIMESVAKQEDMVDIAKGGIDAALSGIIAGLDRETWAYVASNLQEFNVKGGEALTEAIATTAKKAAKGAGIAVASATGTIAAPVIAAGTGAAAVGAGMLGAGIIGSVGVAYGVTEAGRRTAAALNQKRPAIEQGIVGTIAPFARVADNTYNLPRDFQKTLTESAEAINELGQQGVSFFERARKRIADALDAMRTTYNELRQAIRSTPEIDAAIEAYQGIMEELPAEEAQPVEIFEEPFDVEKATIDELRAKRQELHKKQDNGTETLEDLDLYDKILDKLRADYRKEERKVA